MPDNATKICFIVKSIKHLRGGKPNWDQTIRLAKELSKDGRFEITLLLTEQGILLRKSVQYTVQTIPHIKVICLPEAKTPSLFGPTSHYLSTSYAVYEWLKSRKSHFDVVIHEPSRGDAYFSLLAKSLKMRFSETNFVAVANNLIIAKKIRDSLPIDSLTTLSAFFAERRCYELSDIAVCAAPEQLLWLHEHGFHARGQEIIKPQFSGLNAKTIGPFSKTEKIVFFCGSNVRRDIRLIINSFNRLNHETFQPRKNVSISIALPKRRVRSLSTLVAKKKLSKQLKVPVIIEEQDQYFQDSTDQRLRNTWVLSLEDPFSPPFSFYFFLSLDVPYATCSAMTQSLASHIGISVPFFQASPSHISKFISDILTGKSNQTATRFDFSDNDASWLNMLMLETTPTVNHANYPQDLSSNPLVSVCITHRNRGDLLTQAIESIQAQDYGNIEIIVVDDGSDDDYSLSVLEKIKYNADFTWPVSVVMQENKYVAAARNRAAQHASGKYLMFMDDDNIAKSHEIPCFVSVAESNQIDILTCFGDVFAGRSPETSNIPIQRALFYGADLATGLIQNPFGDSNCFVRTEIFRTLGGFPEHFGVGMEDAAFFSKAVLNGYSLEVVPEALFWYRINKSRVRFSHSNPHAAFTRISEIYSRNLQPDIGNAFRYLQGISRKQSLLYTAPIWAREKGRFFALKHPRTIKLLSCLTKNHLQ